MPRYLTARWLDDAAAAMAAAMAAAPVTAAGATGADAPAEAIGITQVVLGGPDGTVTYHVTSHPPGAAPRLATGPAEPEDVRLCTDWATAVAIARGTLSAQQAFVDGRLVLTGSTQRLLGARGLLTTIDAALTSVRAATEFDDDQHGAGRHGAA